MARHEGASAESGEAAKPRRGVGRPRGTGAQLVFERLRERILSLELPPQADIDELSLVGEFSLSRTPVREALIRLSSEGLVELLPNKGPRVAALDLKDVPQILEALELAQRTVNRWAARAPTDSDLPLIQRRADDFARAADAQDATAMSDTNRLFHAAIAAACGNRSVADWYGSLLNSSMRLARLVFDRAPLRGDAYHEYYGRVIDEHRGMAEAIARRDPDAAEALGREHAVLFRDQVQRFMVECRTDEIVLD
jgi:DNA-binding GntR family transcriptional regulator